MILDICFYPCHKQESGRDADMDCADHYALIFVG